MMGTLDGLKRSDGVVGAVGGESAVQCKCRRCGALYVAPPSELKEGKCVRCGKRFITTEVGACLHLDTTGIDPHINGGAVAECCDCGAKSWGRSMLGKWIFSDSAPPTLTEVCGDFAEAVDEVDKDVRALLDQTAESIDRIAGKRDCLKEADKIINGERQDSYGGPEDSFTIIAGYWNVFLTAKLKALGMDVKDLLSPLDTTNMMVLFKQARKLGQKPSRDNYVDSCGYEAIGADRLSE